MALKAKGHRATRHKKGVLLTLLTLILFILILAEIFTYISLNMNNNQLSSQLSQAYASASSGQVIKYSIASFLRSSILNSLNVLYELSLITITNATVANFNGASSYVSVPSSSSVTVSTGDFSVSGWINSTSWANSPNLLGKEYCLSSHPGWIVGFTATGQPNIGMYDGSGAGYTLGNDLNTSTWYNVVYVFSRSSNLTVYVNGVEVGSTSITSESSSLSNSYTMYVGAYSCGSGPTGGYFDGQIANVQMYNSALTSSEVATMYSDGINGAPVDTSTLAAWWPLNGTATDYGGNGNTGSAVNIVYSNISISNAPSMGTSSGSGGASRYAEYLPPNILQYVPVNITNAQSSATTAPFQEMVTINSSKYEQYEASNLQNIEFFYSNGTVINSWLESGNTNTSTSTIYWLKLPAAIPASGTISVYMGFAAQSTNMFNTQTTGEAPQLSSTYAQYDDGANVFTYYNVNPTSTTGWTISGTAGLTSSAPAGSHFSSTSVNDAFYANSANGDYMYSPITNLSKNQIISFNIYTTSLGDLFFLTNSGGSGQMARLDGMGVSTDYSGITSTSSWTNWGAPSGIGSLTGNQWYKYDVVVSGTTATAYIGSASNNLSTLGSAANSYTISDNGDYMGLIGDGAGSSYISYWNGFVVRAYPPSGVMPAAVAGTSVTSYVSPPPVSLNITTFNTTAGDIKQLIYTNILHGMNYSSYMGSTLYNYISALQNQSTSQQLSISIINGSFSVIQSSPFSITATYSALALVNSSVSNSTYPISVNVTVPMIMGASSSYASGSIPAGIIKYVPVNITNTQSSATSAPFQEMVTINSSKYKQYEASNLQNVEFFYSNGTVINSWLESGNTNTSNTTVYWLKLLSRIPASSSILVYMGFANTTTNLFNNQTTGEAPQLSSTYAQYDDGENVFIDYWNFKGTTLPSGLAIASDGASGNVIFNDHATISSTNTDGTNGEFLYGTSTTNPSGKIVDAYYLSGSTDMHDKLIGWSVTAPTSQAGWWGWQNGTGGGLHNNQEVVSISSGAVSQYPSGDAISISPQIISLSWQSSTIVTSYSNYGNIESVSSDIPTIANSYLVGGYSSSGGSMTIQWLRVRSYPPNGVMPIAVSG